MSLKWSNGKVVGKTTWAPGLYTLHVSCPDVAPFDPGQFLQLALELDGELVYRPYSVASPYGPVLDFFIVTVPEGRLSPELEKLEIGDFVQVSIKSAGGFTLDKAAGHDHLWLFATGTGLAPYIAMLRTPRPWDQFDKIVLIHGVREARDLAYQEEIAAWQKEHCDCFRYVACLSREDLDGHMTGRSTCLTNDGSLEESVGLTINKDQSVVMICGNPQMLDELEAILKARGLTRASIRNPGNIISERYW